MSDLAYHEGKAAFKISARDEPCETYYKVYGDLLSGPPPLVILHGGPASGHEYLEPYARLWSDYRIPVVFYDELGCGQSTHLRETVGDKQFWQPGLFADELASLVHHLRLDRSDGPGFDVFGHSFGGIVATAFAARHPPGLRRLVLGGTAADSQIFKKGLWALTRQLPTVYREAIDEAVEKDDFTTQAYKDAMAEFQRTYLCRYSPYPHPNLAKNRQNQAEDNTVPKTMHGRSPLVYDGAMEHYSSLSLIPKINVPTLLFDGEYDTAQYESVVPFFDGIPKVRWVTLAGASHMPHLDSEELLEKCLQLIGRFLQPEVRTIA